MAVNVGKSGNRNLMAAAVVAGLLVVALGAGLYLTKGPGSSSTSSGSNSAIQVVAAENFWGNLASQLGGIHVNVTSVVSDPNVDPHEYQANTADARAISNAKLVIVNGAGYDTWALTVVSAGNYPNQKVLNVQQLTGQPIDANPHLWYSPYFVNDTVKAIYNDLVAIDPVDTSYYHQQYGALNSSLWQSYMSKEVAIRQQSGGSPVAATEDIFVYMANATGLNVVSPIGFMQAVAEGNDPPAQDVANFQQLLHGGKSAVRVLVYNEQTVTPITESMKSLAAQNQIPVTAVTETMPLNTTFQNWMGAELISLQNALNG
jgi:zinc/manganese transport system substrate-binding protein